MKVWGANTGKLIHTFEGHLAGISTISWSPDGATIASGSDDKTIRLWNVLTVSLSFLSVLKSELMSFFRAKHTEHPSSGTTTTFTPSPSPPKATCSSAVLTTKPFSSGTCGPHAS